MDPVVDLKAFLDYKADQYNTIDFIENDPVSIPHMFEDKKNREIMGLWSAILAWGQRKTIINKCHELINLMDGDPYGFIMHHTEKDLARLSGFKHRTFNYTDTLYFVDFFKNYYKNNDTLEDAFTSDTNDIREGLILFHETFFKADYAPHRTKKHIPTPLRKSTCKRLNMFLRWMVRSDKKGVDFGIWKKLTPDKLYCPLDLHVDRVARKLKLIERKQTDWQTVQELTENLRKFDKEDPARYDFALFGLGIEEKF